MFFLTFSNVDVLFTNQKLNWRSYITAKALPIIWQIKIIDKKKFAKVILNKDFKTFVIHVATLEAPLARMTIHLSQKV